MSVEDVFRRIVGVLANVGIPYMLTGSFASSYHGSPRATQDIDLVIAPTQDQLEDLVKLLPPTDYYVDLNDASKAFEDESMFNIIDRATGWKVDLIIRKSRAFSQVEFDRRVAIDVFGVQLFVASAEDIILAKLEWAKLGRSERQVEDVVELLRIRWDELDREYLQKWIDDLTPIRQKVMQLSAAQRFVQPPSLQGGCSLASRPDDRQDAGVAPPDRSTRIAA